MVARRWTARASQRFRSAILERLEAARKAGELAPHLDVTAAAVLLAASLDGLLFHRLVDPTLDGVQTAALRELNDVLTKLLSGNENIKKSSLSGIRAAAEILKAMLRSRRSPRARRTAKRSAR